MGTKNLAEGWHHGLQASLMCHHPTLKKFTHGLNSDKSKQRLSFLQLGTGLPQTTLT